MVIPMSSINAKNRAKTPSREDSVTEIESLRYTNEVWDEFCDGAYRTSAKGIVIVLVLLIAVVACMFIFATYIPGG